MSVHSLALYQAVPLCGWATHLFTDNCQSWSF